VHDYRVALNGLGSPVRIANSKSRFALPEFFGSQVFSLLSLPKLPLASLICSLQLEPKSVAVIG